MNYISPIAWLILQDIKSITETGCFLNQYEDKSEIDMSSDSIHILWNELNDIIGPECSNWDGSMEELISFQCAYDEIKQSIRSWHELFEC